jgi:hypothetical protein
MLRGPSYEAEIHTQREAIPRFFLWNHFHIFTHILISDVPTELLFVSYTFIKLARETT